MAPKRKNVGVEEERVEARERDDGEEIEYEEEEEEEHAFSRNYFLAKEVGSSSGKRSAARKVTEINLDDEQLFLSELPAKHEKEIGSLLESYKGLYSNWLFELRCGFGLLMYGFGSKKALLEDFASSTLTSYTVVVINGYLTSVNLKQVMTAIAEILWEHYKYKAKTSNGKQQHKQLPSGSKSVDDIITFINDISDDCNSLVCLLIHNIDGPALRDPDSQQHLARVSCCSCICLVASIDHVNAPLYDLTCDLFLSSVGQEDGAYTIQVVLAPSTNFCSLQVEGLFNPLILSSSGHVQTTKTALVVLQSLTPNAQSVFRVLAEFQLANEKEEGMHVSELYTKCREQFLVSSQVTLNAHLTEFKDHKLVKMRRHSDGQDCLHIPLPSNALEKLLQDLV